MCNHYIEYYDVHATVFLKQYNGKFKIKTAEQE